MSKLPRIEAYKMRAPEVIAYTFRNCIFRFATCELVGQGKKSSGQPVWAPNFTQANQISGRTYLWENLEGTS